MPTRGKLVLVLWLVSGYKILPVSTGLCNGPSELKWIAGIFFRVSEVESYKETLLEIIALETYKQWVEEYVYGGILFFCPGADLPSFFLLVSYSGGKRKGRSALLAGGQICPPQPPISFFTVTVTA